MIEIAEAPLRGSVPDDRNVVTNDPGRAIVGREGVASLPAAAEVKENHTEAPRLDDRGGGGTSHGDAEDLDDVAVAALVRWRPKDRCGPSPSALAGLSAAAIEGDLDAGEDCGAANDVGLGEGDDR